MKRTLPVLLVLVLFATACSSGAPSSSEDASGTIPGEQDTPSEATSDDEAQNTSDGASKKTDKGKKKGKKSADELASTSGSKGSEDSASKGNSSSSTGSTTGPASPIAAGTYSYETDGTTEVSGSSRPMPDTTTLKVAPPNSSEQTSIRDLRDSDGNGNVTETRFVYTEEGVRLSYVKVTARVPGGFTDVREFVVSPPEMIAPTGSGPGFSRSFMMSGSGTEALVSVATLRRSKVTVNGSKIQAFEVKVTIEFSGALEGEQVSRTWFWPRNLLILREQVQSDVRNGPIRVRSNYNALLRDLPG